MSSIVTSVILVLGFSFLVGLCSLAESALGQVQKWRLRDRAGRGDHGAQAALEVACDLDRFGTSARLIITFATVLIGVVSGVLLCEQTTDSTIATRFTSYPGIVVTTMAAGGVAMAVFVFGDLLPRALARSRPEAFASKLGRVMRLASVVVSPASVLLRRATDVLARWLGASASPAPPATEQRLLDLMREASEAGRLEDARHTIYKRAVRFCDRRARALMTPRDEVVWIDVHDPHDEIRRKVASCTPSHFPVCDGTLDNLLGIVQVKDLLARNADDQGFRIKGILTLPAFIYEGARGPQILDSLKKSSAHTAVVLDEYGSVVGVLTLSDVVDAIVGPMADESHADEPRAVPRGDGSWLFDGRFAIDEFFDFFQIHETTDDDYNTLGGLIVTRLGHIPDVGESFAKFGLRFEVVDRVGNRVDRVLVQPVDLHA
ncbi:hemolysin family protein [Paludisphaera borealis]|uniref:Magnesium and cobalt efflux protein CorC n=1 Tax=Paludisphaera borealis TaxID=1387353 RepID=A0A1U7CXE6_9BACT|nr:hemolysin family protein [Paludisphaera borealis]APW63553.1 Magnesium and cobalt efflux protein CorC [Paludisphaera borealis]